MLAVTGPAEITFSHTMGVTPCPQPIAVLTVTNTIQEPIQWVAVEADYGGPERIEGAPFSGTLQPGESVTINVSFRCSTDKSFTSAFDISGTTGPAGMQSTVLVPVVGTIDATVGSLTVTASTSGGAAVEYRVQDVELGTDLGTIGANETKTFTGVRPGRYPIRLIPEPSGSDCTVDGGSVQDIVVPAGGTASTSFSVTCVGPKISADAAPPLTTYTVSPGVPAGVSFFAWSGANCGSVTGSTTDTMIWDHGAADCEHAGVGHPDATISLFMSGQLPVSGRAFELRCTYPGALSGDGPECVRIL